ncbi:MAG: GNAT family N-acetyltransferase [Burkholderiaceae bacterium]
MKMKEPVVRRVAAYVVQSLTPQDRARILRHLMSLDDGDRWLRFGVAHDADALARYVAAIDFDSSSVLGAALTDGSLIGVAHIALRDAVAELGISVSPGQRQNGVAGALAAAALREAQRMGAQEFRFESSASNAGMRRLARQLGMHISAQGAELVAQRSVGAADPQA